MTAMISDFLSRAHGEGQPSGRSVGELLSGEVADVPMAHWAWVVAFLLGAMTRDALGDPDAAGRALQSVLDLAEPDQALPPFLVHPSAGPPDRPARHHTAGATLICEAADLLAQADRPAPPLDRPTHREALTHGETRVLRYLPTNLSAQEIAHELYLSVNTVKTHQRHVYQKLGARSRTQAVEQARALGLLAPSSHGRWP
jgi:LuxR family transcriptional regulator, maltose regulon positive regulatory protein